MAIDLVTHNIYLPTAQFPPTPEGSRQRPAPIAGSFMILVVGK
ncbi:MAG: hypothetical protein ABSG67_10430 [Thermoguttaceae bacterium]|jgi:hypothetical protein